MVGKRCKRMASALIALVCVLALSVPSFALVNDVNYADLPTQIKEFLLPYSGAGAGAYQMDVKFEGAHEAYNTEANREAWKKVMGEWLQDSDYQVFFFFSPTYFWVCAAPVNAISATSTDFRASSGHYFQFHLGSAGADKRGVLSKATTGSWTSPTAYASQTNYYFLDNGVRSTLQSISSRTYGIVKDMRTLVITDDVREVEPEPPTSSSEPDPPVEPSLPDDPPADPYNPAGPPSIGSVDSEYLPYDTEVWDAVMWYLRDAIGSAGRVIFLVVAVATVLPVVLSVLRHYIGDRNDHGGGLL